MRKRGLVTSFVLTLLICFGAFAAVMAVNWRPLLGLDLKGGLSVVYCPAARGSTTKCAPSKQVSQGTLNQVVNIIQNRVNGLGVAQPNIGVQGGNVVAQLPGVKDPSRIEKLIGTTAQLYFRPVLCFAPPYQKPASTTHPKKSKATSGNTSSTTSTSTSQPSSSSSTTSTTAAKSATTTAAKSTSSTSSTSTSTSTTTTTTVPAGKGPLPTCPSSYQPTSSFTPPSYTPLAAYPSTLPQNDLPSATVLLNDATTPGLRYELGPSIASGSIIKSASAQYTNTGWIIAFTLTGPGTSIFNNKIALPYYHKLIADDLGGVVETAPAIDSTNFPGSGQISASTQHPFTTTEAQDIALVLNYGALPVRLVQQNAQTISPTLGSQSLKAGLLAGLLGLLLVMGYTIFYYRALGIVVVLGLVSTAALLYAIISWLSHTSANLTLDLSGITGLIVSVGITVDSYVVYFERLKDEVRAGRSIRSSVDRGFKSAYRTILSADAVSFIGALVLWLLSVGAVRGFAFMLGLSTLIDVATAYFFTRPLVILLGRNRVFTEARGLGVARGLAVRPADEAA